MGSVTFKPGDVLQDTYEVVSPLGEGGMAATYEARHRATGHLVAIKVIAAQLAADPLVTDLFRREASLLRTVRHDAVVSYEGFLQDAQGRLYLIMEYIEGKPLQWYLDQGARLGAEDVRTLGERLGSGLTAIHAKGIVHRDISPDNLILCDDSVERAKIVDFGLASDTIGTDRSILSSSFAGKLTYAAPEQMGLFGGKVSGASDLYALALVLARCSGLPIPRIGSLAEAMETRKVDITFPGSAVPEDLRRRLEACLRADPDARAADPVAIWSQPPPAAPATTGATAPPREDSVIFDTPPPPLRTPAPATGGGAGRAPILAGLALVAVAALGAGAYFAGLVPGGGEETTGCAAIGSPSHRQACEVMEGSEPLRTAQGLIDEGGRDNLDAALGALMAFARDDTQPDAARAQAAALIAQMYDPATFDPARSPFSEPNPNAARRFWETAERFGSPLARDALAALGGEGS